MVKDKSFTTDQSQREQNLTNLFARGPNTRSMANSNIARFIGISPVPSAIRRGDQEESLMQNMPGLISKQQQKTSSWSSKMHGTISFNDQNGQDIDQIDPFWSQNKPKEADESSEEGLEKLDCNSNWMEPQFVLANKESVETVGITPRFTQKKEKPD